MQTAFFGLKNAPLDKGDLIGMVMKLIPVFHCWLLSFFRFPQITAIE